MDVRTKISQLDRVYQAFLGMDLAILQKCFYCLCFVEFEISGLINWKKSSKFMLIQDLLNRVFSVPSGP